MRSAADAASIDSRTLAARRVTSSAPPAAVSIFAARMKSFSRQPADGVRREFDGDVAVAGQVQVGVMVLRLGDLADAVEEVQRRSRSP